MPLFTGPTFNAALDALTVGLSQVLFPVVLLLGLTGLLVGILQSYDHFTIPAISPGGVEPRDHRPAGRPAPALPRRLEQAISCTPTRSRSSPRRSCSSLMAPARSGGSTSACSCTIDWHDPRIKQVFMLMLPVTIGLGHRQPRPADQLGLRHARLRRSAARDRQRLPHLHAAAGAVQRGGRDRAVPDAQPHGLEPRRAGDARARSASAMRQINLLLIPSAAFMIVLATPIVRLVFQRGQFDAQSTAARLRSAVLVRLQPAVRRPEPAADADVLRACSARGSRRGWRR